MLSAKFNLIKPFSRRLTKDYLQTLDVVYGAQPFVRIVSKNQNTYDLDTAYNAKPFLAASNSYSTNGRMTQ